MGASTARITKGLHAGTIADVVAVDDSTGAPLYDLQIPGVCLLKALPADALDLIPDPEPEPEKPEPKA